MTMFKNTDWWVRPFIWLQVVYAVPLLALGIFRALEIGKHGILKPSYLPYLPYPDLPFVALSFFHLTLAWALRRGVVWFWIPHLLTLLVWLGVPVLLMESSARGGPGPAMLGPPPAALLSLPLVAPVCLLQMIALAAAWSRREVWRARAQSSQRPSLLLFCALLPVVVGFDLYRPLRRAQFFREAAHSYQLQLDESKRAVDELVRAAIATDDGDLAEARRRVEDLRGRNFRRDLTLEFLFKALKHPDLRVRTEAVRLLIPPTAKSSVPTGALGPLLSVVADPAADASLRRDVVVALLQNESATVREKLYPTLAALENDKPFVVSVLAAYIADERQSHWSPGGAPSAPSDAVQLLEAWGPSAAEAVPALADALVRHPNRWNFAPAIANALGAMGPEAQAAIPALQIAARSTGYSELRSAAERALMRIEGEKLEDARSIPPTRDANPAPP